MVRFCDARPVKFRAIIHIQEGDVGNGAVFKCLLRSPNSDNLPQSLAAAMVLHLEKLLPDCKKMQIDPS
jgi:hypothetical protein